MRFPLLQAAYQNIVTLSYVDKLIDQVCLAFRDKYKNDLVSGSLRMVNFSQDFHVSCFLLWYFLKSLHHSGIQQLTRLRATAALYLGFGRLESRVCVCGYCDLLWLVQTINKHG